MAQQQVEKNNDDNKSSTQGNDDAIFIQAKMKGNYPWIDYIEGSNMKSQQIYGFFGNDHFFAWGMSKYEWDDFNAGIMEMNQIFKMMNEFGPLNVKLIIKWRDQEYEKKDIKIDLNGKIYGMDVDDLADIIIKECKHDESGDLKNIGEVIFIFFHIYIYLFYLYNAQLRIAILRRKNITK